MVMSINIQHPSINELYDFASAIHERIHEGLVRAENKDTKLEFFHYSLVCHLILYQNRAYWGLELRIKTNDPYTGLPWPVQRWTHVWDKGSKFGVFCVFFDHFVMNIFTRLRVVLPRLPK